MAFNIDNSPAAHTKYIQWIVNISEILLNILHTYTHPWHTDEKKKFNGFYFYKWLFIKLSANLDLIDGGM